MENDENGEHFKRDYFDEMGKTLDALHTVFVVAVQELSQLGSQEKQQNQASEPPANEGPVTDGKADEEFGHLDPWGDEKTRSFYVDLPDVTEFLTEHCVEKQQDESADDEEDSEEENCYCHYRLADFVTEGTHCTAPDGAECVGDHIYCKGVSQQSERDPDEEANTGSMVADGGCAAPSNRGFPIDFKEFLDRLPYCNQVDSINYAAVEFLLALNTKRNRERLVLALCDVKVDNGQYQLNLLPMYARFVAIINSVTPDVGQELGHMLKIEFAYHLRKDRIDIMERIKVVRYIGELVMFGILNKTVALDCLYALLERFERHNVELTCELLEVCGIYLYNSPDSRMRTNAFLEQMMQKKTTTPMLERHAQLVENVYQLVKEPHRSQEARTQRSPIRMYIRKLLFQDMNDKNACNIAQLLLCMNWNDERTFEYAVESLMCPHDIEAHLIKKLAEVLSKLVPQHRRAVDLVTKTVLLDIRADLETYDDKLAERRIAMVQYLGELYNYTLVTSSDILHTLHAIISCGVTLSHTEPPSDADPVHSMLRLEMVLMLLNTCGQYFKMGDDRRLLDEFLYLFQRYFWYKKSHPYFAGSTARDMFPFRTESDVLACLCRLRPKMTIFCSFDQASAAVYLKNKEHEHIYRWLLETQQYPSQQSAYDEDFIQGTADSPQMAADSDEFSTQLHLSNIEWFKELDRTITKVHNQIKKPDNQDKDKRSEDQVQQPGNSGETSNEGYKMKLEDGGCESSDESSPISDLELMQMFKRTVTLHDAFKNLEHQLLVGNCKDFSPQSQQADVEWVKEFKRTYATLIAEHETKKTDHQLPQPGNSGETSNEGYKMKLGDGGCESSDESSPISDLELMQMFKRTVTLHDAFKNLEHQLLVGNCKDFSPQSQQADVEWVKEFKRTYATLIAEHETKKTDHQLPEPGKALPHNQQGQKESSNRTESSSKK